MAKYKPAAYIVLAVLAFSPFAAAAANMHSIWPTGWWGPIVECSGSPISAPGIVTSNQPTCGGPNDIIQTFLNVIVVGMSLGIFVLAPFFFAWGGILVLIAGSSPDQMGKGKKILTGTVVGVIIILAAYLIIKTFVSFLGIGPIGGFS